MFCYLNFFLKIVENYEHALMEKSPQRPYLLTMSSLDIFYERNRPDNIAFILKTSKTDTLSTLYPEYVKLALRFRHWLPYEESNGVLIYKNDHLHIYSKFLKIPVSTCYKIVPLNEGCNLVKTEFIDIVNED